MSEKTKSQKKSWFKGLKAEFQKIIWPDRQTLTKQSIAVVTISVFLGILIAVVDTIVKFGVDFLVK